MKICYLADANSIHTKKMCEYFIEQGNEVSVISLNDGSIKNAKVYSMHMNIKNTGSVFSKIRYLKKIFKIKLLVKKIKPDVIHAHYASSYGLFANVIGFKPTIISVWGSDVYDFPNQSLVNKLILKSNLKKADYILSTSNIMKRETQKYTDKDIVVTPFGVNIDTFKPKDKKNKCDNTVTIGTIKTLEEKYGIEFLIRAFKKVKVSNPNIDLKLIIGGMGSQLNFLKALTIELDIEKDIEFIGFVSQNEVVNQLQNFDIAVFPSILDSESFGVAAVEAQSCGIPLVVTDVDGLMESTVPNITSLVAKRKSVDDLADKIDILVKNNELRQKMSIAARSNVVDKYNIKQNFKIIDDIYKTILKK